MVNVRIMMSTLSNFSASTAFKPYYEVVTGVTRQLMLIYSKKQSLKNLLLQKTSDSKKPVTQKTSYSKKPVTQKNQLLKKTSYADSPLCGFPPCFTHIESGGTLLIWLSEHQYGNTDLVAQNVVRGYLLTVPGTCW